MFRFRAAFKFRSENKIGRLIYPVCGILSRMLVILIRTIIIMIFLLVGMRLMGKRQIGELQPFEFVITLAVAELACTPMQDVSIPLSYGIVPLLTIFVIHFLLTLLSTKSVGFRKLMNGKPVIVVNEDGIDIESLKKMNMNVNDLLECIRGSGYFSIPEVSFAIIETNGKCSIMENTEAEKPQSVPLTLIVEGKYLEANLHISNTSKEEITRVLKEQRLKLKDVVLMTSESGNLFIQPKNQRYITLSPEAAA